MKFDIWYFCLLVDLYFANNLLKQSYKFYRPYKPDFSNQIISLLTKWLESLATKHSLIIIKFKQIFSIFIFVYILIFGGSKTQKFVKKTLKNTGKNKKGKS